MKFTTSTTVLLLSKLICSEAAMYSRPSPHKVHEPVVHHFKDDLTACKGRLNSPNTLTWTPYQMRLCLKTAVHFDDSKVLNELLPNLRAMNPSEKIEVEKSLPDLVFTCSVDKHEALLYDLLRVTKITPELTRKCFGRAASEGSLKALKRWIEHVIDISTDARDTAVIEAWTSGHRNIVDFIFRSPRFKVDWSNELVNNIFRQMYPGGIEAHQALPEEPSKEIAVTEAELKEEPPMVEPTEEPKVELKEVIPEKPFDQVYLSDEAENVLAEESSTEYFTPESSASAEDEDLADESPEEEKHVVVEPTAAETSTTNAATEIRETSTPTDQDDISVVPVTPTVPQQARVSYDIDPLSWPEEEHWIDKHYRNAPKTHAPVKSKQPETSWFGSIRRAITETVWGPESSIILPEETWDSTYGPKSEAVKEPETKKRHNPYQNVRE